MTTVLEDIYNMFEQHEERVFLDFMRENKKFLFEKEKKQMSTSSPTIQEQSVEKPKSTLNIKSV